MTRRPLGELPCQSRNIWSGCDLGDQLFDLALGPVRGPFQERVSVLPGETGSELGDSGQVEATVTQHHQEHRVLPRGTCHGDAQIGFRLGEVQDVGAVGEHRGRSLAGIEPSLVHLGDVSDEVGLDAPGLEQEVGQAKEQLVVRQCLERTLVFHAGNIGLPSSTSGKRAYRAPATESVFEGPQIVCDVRGAAWAARVVLTVTEVASYEVARETCQGENERKFGAGIETPSPHRPLRPVAMGALRPCRPLIYPSTSVSNECWMGLVACRDRAGS